MPDDQKPPVPLPAGGMELKLADIPFLNSDNVRPVYSNNTAVFATQWDFRMSFSEIILDPAGARTELRASVVMSPAHAKAIAQVLQQQIEVYEKTNGKVIIPKQVADMLKQAAKQQTVKK